LLILVDERCRMCPLCDDLLCTAFAERAAAEQAELVAALERDAPSEEELAEFLAAISPTPEDTAAFLAGLADDDLPDDAA
jgi:hypothetical protein